MSSLETMFGGFRERADETYKLLKEAGTSFVVVAVPERDALREAAYFVERLETEHMPLAGLVLNRVHTSAAPRPVRRAVDRRGRSARRGRRASRSAPRCCGSMPSGSALAARDGRRATQFRSAHPSVKRRRGRGAVQRRARPRRAAGDRLGADERPRGHRAERSRFLATDVRSPSGQMAIGLVPASHLKVTVIGI